MKTLSVLERNKLEGEVIKALCTYDHLYREIEIIDAYFFNPFYKKIWLKIREFIQTGQKVNYVNMLGDFPSNEIKFLFEDNEFIVGGAFIDAVKRLEEDYKRNEVNRMAEESNDVNSFITSVDRIRNIGTTYSVKSLEDHTSMYLETIKKRKERSEENGTTGLIHDWRLLAEKVRFEPGELIVLGARTSIGKTSFCINFAEQVASYGQKVLFISMEMSNESIIDRIASSMTHTELKNVKTGNVSPSFIQQEFTAINKNLFIVHAPGATSETVVNLASKMKFDLVIVDYLQLLRDKPVKGELETYRIGRMLKNLQQLAGERKFVIMTPAQLNRKAEGATKPSLIDLRDSGSIEQDADVIMFLHRDDRDSIVANLSIVKNRNGELGEIEFAYALNRQIFKESKKS